MTPVRFRAPAVAALATAATLALAPGAAGMVLKVTYEVDEESNLRTLTIKGDENANEIVVGCANGDVSVEHGPLYQAKTGLPLTCGGALGAVPVPGPQAIVIAAEGGNDRIDTTDVLASDFKQLVSFNGHRTSEVRIFGGPGEDTMIGGPLGERFNAT